MICIRATESRGICRKSENCEKNLSMHLSAQADTAIL